MSKKHHYKDSLSRNRNKQELAEDHGHSSGESRDKNQLDIYKVRNAGQGQVKIRGNNQNK